MVSERDVSAAIGSTAYGSDGESVGTVETFYTDDVTGATTWVSVSSGLLGRKQVIAPAQDATFVDGRLQLSVPADAVSSAPRMSGEHLSPTEEEELRRHYAQGLAPSGDDIERSPAVSGTAGDEVPDHAAGRHADTEVGTAGIGTAGTGEAARGDGSMVRSEEQLRVGTERVVARRMRVVKYVITEEVQVTVPIRREEIRIEEIPEGHPDPDGGVVSEGDSLGTGPGTGSLAGGLPEEIVLHAERPVVSVEVVPVERVRLRTEVVAGQESVTETVQRERVTVDEHPAPHRS